ncbi:MAG: hypothetical protein Q4G09_02770 [Clostridia bacterium]|nr:hypothetical protein [Clostridia bacterium]
MSIEDMLSYAEVDEILNLLDYEYAKKIPEKVRDLFRNERMPDYAPKIDLDISLEQQNLQRKTTILLAVLNLNYWCQNENEKQDFLIELADNEKEKRELEEKYSLNNLFKNRNKDVINNNQEEHIEITKYKKQNFLQKILKKIRNLLKK